MTNHEKLIGELRSLATEKQNPDTADLDRLTAVEICEKINDADKTVAGIVAAALKPISRAASEFANSIRSGGRVIYIGAGTSGRLGVLDAAECPPTFGTDPSQILGVIAGGNDALIRSVEGAEDSEDDAIRDLSALKLSNRDMVIGICASKRTPYTLAGIEQARKIGCVTAFIVCNKADNLPVKPDILIELPVGPEVLTGSTRMKSGTAQKMALNMISTTAMVLLGKTLGNLMVDLLARSEKLAARSQRILIDLLSISNDQASELLSKAGGSVKTAIVMHRFGCGRDTAIEKLDSADGFISRLSD